jgi:hypothetical protein
MSSKTETKESVFRRRIEPSPLTRTDIDAILYTRNFRGAITKLRGHYKIGPQRIKNIWEAENPYDHADSNGPPNPPPWYSPDNTSKDNVNGKDADVKSIENSNPDADEKRKKKEDDIRQAVKALKKLVNSEY